MLQSVREEAIFGINTSTGGTLTHQQECIGAHIQRILYLISILPQLNKQTLKVVLLHKYITGSKSSIVYLRSGPVQEKRPWNKNWDFCETNKTRSRSPDRNHIPSLNEYSRGVAEQKSGSDRPSATRHLLFIRHGQYVKAEEDEKKILTEYGRFVVFLVCNLFIYS